MLAPNTTKWPFGEKLARKHVYIELGAISIYGDHAFGDAQWE